MRVTAGSISARFQRVRLAMGEGLGGAVAQSAMPYSTASYFEDERFKHTTDIDGAVTEEGLVAILGVPLQLGSTVIGVLYAANRSERPFTRSEVALLSSLAAHASAAIDKARLLDETRAALGELRNVNLLLQERTQSVERASDAHDRMAQVVLHGGGIEDVAKALVDVLGGALVVLDGDGRRLCEAGAFSEPADISAEQLDQAVGDSLASGRVAVQRITDGAAWYVTAITVDQRRFGALALQRTHELDDADQRILERASLVTALLMLSVRSAHEAENRVRGEILDDLLRNPHQDPEGLNDRARRVGADLELPHAVFVIGLLGADRARTLSAVEHVAARSGGLSGSFEGRLVLLLPEGSHTGVGATAHRLAEELGGSVTHPVTVGGAGPVCGISELAEAHREAVRCVTALGALGRDGQGASLEELGFVGMVLGDDPDVTGFVSASLGPILEYDARRGTDLMGTLQAYFVAGGNLARTKELLHVHVNTVSQRLDRIGKLIGEDWQAPERQLELHVAVRLHQVAAARDEGGDAHT
jgi:DNA-binding PucR family transcriptional regulator